MDSNKQLLHVMSFYSKLKNYEIIKAEKEFCPVL